MGGLMLTREEVELWKFTVPASFRSDVLALFDRIEALEREGARLNSLDTQRCGEIQRLGEVVAQGLRDWTALRAERDHHKTKRESAEFDCGRLEVERDAALRNLATTRRAAQESDCSYGETGGLHCPPGAPCLRCQRDALRSVCEEWLEADSRFVSLEEQRKRWSGIMERMAAAVLAAGGKVP
jgi:hypothetical protein